MEKLWLLLLVFTPLALLASLAHASPLLVFILSALAIIPLAKYIGDATNELTSHTNAGIGGFLNATFGNATELIVGIFALHAGLLDVVKASIIGSVLGNVLLVLGTSIFVGGWKRERQKFNETAAKAGCSMLLLASIALVVPALFEATSPGASEFSLMTLSIVVAVLMIIGYGAQLFFSLRTHRHLYQSYEGESPANWSIKKSIIVLGASTVAVSFVSDTLVTAITPLVTSFGWTQLFIGVIIVAIVGNAAEHVSAVRAALRNHMDLAIGITIGSATQIVMFVAPVLVLLSLILHHPMDLVFSIFELVAFIFAVFVTNAIIEDGETNWLEGVQLLLAYAILAVAFFLHA